MQPVNGLAQSTNPGQLVDIFHRGHIIANLNVQAALETGNELLELARLKVFAEDAQNGSIDQLLNNAILTHIAHRIQFDLATGRSHDSREVADARRGIALFETQSAPARVTYHVLEVCHRHAYTHARTLANVVAA